MSHRKMKNKKKRLISIVIVVCIICSALFCFVLEKNGVFGKSDIDFIDSRYVEKKLTQTDSAKKGSIDVLTIGNSDLFSGINPLQLWNEKGITSYAAGVSMQNMCSVYYMLDEILKYQKPKVVILELDNFFETRGKDSREEALKDTYETCYPLFRYTPLWEELKDQPYTQEEAAYTRTFTRGYYYSNKVQPYRRGYSYMGRKTGEEPMVAYTKKYFPKIMELLEENNCQVIFLCLPSRTSWTYRKHNTVEKYAQKYNVPYIDMNIDAYNLGFNWKTDSRDAGNHLNYNGATKVTTFLGDYLTQNYSLTDHRENPEFSDWNNDYLNFSIKLCLEKNKK